MLYHYKKSALLQLSTLYFSEYSNNNFIGTVSGSYAENAIFWTLKGKLHYMSKHFAAAVKYFGCGVSLLLHCIVLYKKLCLRHN